MNVIAFTAVLFIIYIFITLSNVYKTKKQWKALNHQGITKENLITVETYAGGHPGMDNNISDTVLYKFENLLIIADQVSPGAPPENKSFIPLESIRNIGIIDSNSLENIIKNEKAFLVGTFALTWQNKRENEQVFVIIDWCDGNLEHSTIFSFEGRKAMQKAKIALKALIKILN